jgi:Cu+-exporting ATPase
VKPAGKVAAVAKLQAAGRRVVMVGDGLNDAAALEQAEVGMAMAAGSDLAIEAGDVALLRGDLRGVGEAIALGRMTMRVMRQNLGWAFVYNVVGIPVAALGLLNPGLAAGAMALSSVSVVLNSLRLR